MNPCLIILASEPTVATTLGTILALTMALFLLVLMPIYNLLQGRRKYRPRKLQERYRKAILNLQYYQKLNPKQKKQFEIRIQKFINQKKFIARSKNWVLTDAMIAHIAASAIELTFGWKDFRFEHFEKILVYPDDYYSKISKQYHRGEVNPRGFIILSWKAFEEGYADPKDGINLGIHEMAHALKLENTILNSDYNFISDQQALQLELAFDRFKIGKSSLEGFFRNYAKTNPHEFFAISCENFLERPEELKERDPKYYALMSAILRQDPLKLGLKQESASPYPTKGPVERY